ncbi:MAG TPA: hypothetical protein PLY94_05955 [Gemmatimonadaceae bacterium]|nr:hypothetical protein [Gemmatimonadaceae bacterium]
MTDPFVPALPAAPRTRRRFPVVRTALAVLAFALLLVPLLWWRLTPPRDVGVVVVDKTLPHPRWREHERVHWWLDSRRVQDPRGEVAWRPESDYVGYDPVAARGRDLEPSDLTDARLVYVADAYGVYSGDFPDATDSARTSALGPSRLIYGGMRDAEVDALEDFVARGGSVVAEFNTLEDPTAGTAAGDRLGALLGVRFDRWLGRWYGDLASDDEIATWMRERYERVHWKPWRFSGPGLVVFSDVDDRIVVIDSSEFTARWPVTLEVAVREDPLMRGVREGQPYWYWFSGVTPSDSGIALAHFALHVTDAAKARLRAMGFPARPVAVVRHRGSGVRAYLAGDFADVGTAPPPLRRTRGLDWLARLQGRSAKPGRQQRFFWRVTVPIWDGMLAEATR